MTTSLFHFYRLITLKNKPQDLPYSISNWGILLILSTLAFFWINKDSESISGLLLIFNIQNIAFLMTLYYSLKFFGKANRFIQTSSNFFGITIINCLALKFLTFLTLNKIILCLFFGWLIMLKLHIIEHTFDISKNKALLFLLLFFIIPTIAVMFIMPIFSAIIPTINIIH